MVIKVNNTALPGQVKEALRSNDQEAWARIKKGLAPKKELSFIATLKKGTVTTYEKPASQASEAETPRPENITRKKNKISAQIRKAIKNRDAESWSQVKKGLMPQKDVSAIKELTPGTLVAMETQTTEDGEFHSISTTPPEKPETPSPKLRQATSSYASNNVAPDSQNVEELLEIKD